MNPNSILRTNLTTAQISLTSSPLTLPPSQHTWTLIKKISQEQIKACARILRRTLHCNSVNRNNSIYLQGDHLEALQAIIDEDD